MWVDETTAVFVVMAVTLVVWLGIFAYLWGLDRKVRRLEKEIRKHGKTVDTSRTT